MTFITTDFGGCVTTKHGVNMPDGRVYWGFIGSVSILEGKDMLGFEVKDDSNWIARIENDGRSVNIPGCQVQAVMQGDFLGDAQPSAHYLRL